MTENEKYNTADLAGMIIAWTKKNNYINISQKYSFNSWMMLAEIHACLSPEKNFETKKYDTFIFSLTEEITYGKLIIEKIKELRNINKELNISMPKEVIETITNIEAKVKILESNLEKINSFITKIEPFNEYKKDTEKYQKEIVEIFEIL